MTSCSSATSTGRHRSVMRLAAELLAVAVYVGVLAAGFAVLFWRYRWVER